jgi:2-keto-4-pentenoate hydratase
MSETIAAFAARLIAAHNGGPLIDAVPDHLVPADAAGAYALQDEIIGQIGSVGGWKILAGASALSCSPIPTNRYFADGASVSSRQHGFVLAEVEIAVKLGADLGANADAAAVEAAIASLHPILEMVASPFVDRDAIAANAKMGDLQSNGCVVVGPELDPAIKTELTTLPVRLLLDGTEAKAATAGASWATIVEALRWLASHAAARGLPLRAGQVIITGARALAPHAPAALVVGDLGKWGKVSASMTY